jgi:NAD(P)-dependent dehydrogenase (short-subunit alcohol dehydrogenase family)
MNSLGGRVSVITGAAMGLGFAIAEEFVAEGATVVGCDILDEAGAAAMKSIGAVYVHADVSHENEMEAAVATAVDRFGRLDILVNNAGIGPYKDLTETTEEELDRDLAVNLKGTFFGCKHAVRAMKKNNGTSRGGVIVNITSVCGLVGYAPVPAYCASKAGVIGLTRSVAVAYGRDGIRCVSIVPGDIDTPLLSAYFDRQPDPDAERARVASVYPIGRIATPREVARTVVYVASDDASFITAIPLVVDGGLLSFYPGS